MKRNLKCDAYLGSFDTDSSMGQTKENSSLTVTPSLFDIYKLIHSLSECSDIL